MATRKNPLSALLNTDSRQQAEDFTRDHVVRSTVREAGTYGVGVQRTLPASQTSLGRLSASLGTMSGILNQFTQYQTQLEQAELRKEGIEHQIEMQGIRSEQLDEAVKQQNIRLAQINQQRADVEFKQKLASMLPEESDEFFNEHAARVEEAKEAAIEAEKRVHKDHGGINRNNPLLSDVNQRFIGAGRAQVYKDKFIEHQKDFFERMPEMENGAAINDEEAQKLADDFIESFMEENNIDKNSAIGKGFLMSVSKFNEVEIPKFGRAIAERSEGLATQNMLTAMKNYGETNTNFDDIEEQPWFAVLNSLPQDKFLAAIQGTKNSPGLIGLMSHSADSANRLQLMFGQLKDRIQIGGDDLGEFGGYDLLMAGIEDSATRAASREAANDSTAINNAIEEGTPDIVAFASTASSADAFDFRQKLLNPDLPPEERRELLERILPNANINRLSDDKLFEFALDVERRVSAYKADAEKLVQPLIAEASKTKNVVNTPRALRETLSFLKQRFDGKSDSVSVNAQSRIVSIMNSIGTTGADLESTSPMMNRDFADFDNDSGGLVSTYIRDLNRLATDLRKENPDINSTEFKESFGEGIDALNKKLEDSLYSHFLSESNRRLGFIEALKTADYEKLDEVSPDIRGLDLDEIRTTVNKNYQTTPEESVELTKKLRKFNDESVPTLLNSAEFTKEVDPKVLESTRRVTTAKSQAAFDSFFSSSGKNFAQLARLTDALVLYSSEKGMNYGRVSTHYMDLEEEGVLREKYNAGMNSAEAALRERYRLSITADNALSIAGFAKRFPEEKTIPVFDGDRFLNKPQGLFPSNRGKQVSTYAYSPNAGRIEEEGHRVNTVGEIYKGVVWNGVKRDITVPRGFLRLNKPPIEGLRFGKKAPTTEAEVNTILKKTFEVDDMSRVFDAVAAQYGYKTTLELLQAQFNSPYYANKRTLNKQ